MQDKSKDGTKSKDSVEEILATAKKRFHSAVEAESETRKHAIDDLKFMVGDQWPMDVRNHRTIDNRPCLTINRIPQFVRQVTNDQRQNRPSIKINPVDDKADLETAKVIQGIVRHIEYGSHADVAYDTAFEQAVETGLGYFRLITEFSDPMSFQQEIRIKRVKDRFSVYLDPFYQEPDGSDAMWGFVFEDMSADEFKFEFPDAELSRMADWDSLGQGDLEWIKKDSVRVAEYFTKDFEEITIVRLSDGSVLEKDKMPKELHPGVRVVAERKTSAAKIKWYKINGLEILEQTEVPGEFIPIIPVLGEEQIVEGKRILSGIIRHAKDPQRMYNYWKSSQTETIALAPRAPFIGYEKQFEGFEDQWKTANVRNHAYLQVKAISLPGGAPAPLPTRNVYEPPVQAITMAAQQASDDLKATTGIYDATLGNRSNEQSGVAIQRRNVQAQTSNFHFIDNLSRSLRHAGRIIVGWIPKVYDTPQAIRVIGDDGEIDSVQINQMFEENGEQKAFHLDLGKYDVTVDTGPSYATKRQEAVASMLDLSRSAPQLMNLAGDLMVRNMDWPGAQEIADRIKKSLPPNITDDGKSGQPEVPPQVQQQMQQMQAMIQGLTQHLNENVEIIRTKSLELASKERIASMEMETQLIIERLKHDAKDAQLAFAEELKHLRERGSQLEAQNPIPNIPLPNTQVPNSGVGGQMPAGPDQQQPTGGQAPGPSMGVNP